VLIAILQIVKDVARKSVAFQVLAMNLLSLNVVQNARKSPCPEMHGFCNFAFFVHQKSRAPERVKRDPHLFDLVIFLHPKKCLTCGREKFTLLLVLETVPGTFAW
jgi:hypothetical protein